ncbi:MAG: hypothetical protein M1825_003885 [Sarcosagium campestre]|nr:MAG: hypothetical protein M1825_003885 [Sarcosagium campestre]
MLEPMDLDYTEDDEDDMIEDQDSSSEDEEEADGYLSDESGTSSGSNDPADRIAAQGGAQGRYPGVVRPHAQPGAYLFGAGGLRRQGPPPARVPELQLPADAPRARIQNGQAPGQVPADAAPPAPPAPPVAPANPPPQAAVQVPPAQQQQQQQQQQPEQMPPQPPALIENVRVQNLLGILGVFPRWSTDQTRQFGGDLGSIGRFALLPRPGLFNEEGEDDANLPLVRDWTRAFVLAQHLDLRPPGPGVRSTYVGCKHLTDGDGRPTAGRLAECHVQLAYDWEGVFDFPLPTVLRFSFTFNTDRAPFHFVTRPQLVGGSSLCQGPPGACAGASFDFEEAIWPFAPHTPRKPIPMRRPTTPLTPHT